MSSSHLILCHPPIPPSCVVLNDVELLRKAAGQALRGLAWPEGAAGLEGTLPRPLLSCIAAKDGEALYSQQKQDRELTVAQIMNSLLPNSDSN